jgi:hypothetical protein
MLIQKFSQLSNPILRINKNAININRQMVKRICCNKKYVKTEKEKKMEAILVSSMFGGGIIGGGYFATKAYVETKGDSLSETVCITTSMIFTGVISGRAAVVISPIIAPIALFVATIRYFDPPEPVKYDSEDLDYTLYPV